MSAYYQSYHAPGQGENVINQKRKVPLSKFGSDTGREPKPSYYGTERCETLDGRYSTVRALPVPQMEQTVMHGTVDTDNGILTNVLDTTASYSHTGTSSAATNIITRSEDTEGPNIISHEQVYYHPLSETLGTQPITDMKMGQNIRIQDVNIPNYQTESTQYSTNMENSIAPTNFPPTGSPKSRLQTNIVPATAEFLPTSMTLSDHTNQTPNYQQGAKPEATYAEIIIEAFKAHPGKQLLTLNEIYTSIIEKYPYFKNAPPGWKNSIRHNLSLHKAFARVVRPSNIPGKGSFWKLATGGPEEVPKKHSNTRRSVSENPTSFIRRESTPGPRHGTRDNHYSFNYLHPDMDAQLAAPLRHASSGNTMFDMSHDPSRFQSMYHPHIFSQDQNPAIRRRAFSMNPYPLSHPSNGPTEQLPYGVSSDAFQASFSFPDEHHQPPFYAQSVVPQMIMNAPLSFYPPPSMIHPDGSVPFTDFAHMSFSTYPPIHTSSEESLPSSTQPVEDPAYLSYSRGSTSHQPQFQRDDSPVHWDPLRAIHQTNLGHQLSNLADASERRSSDHTEGRVKFSVPDCTPETLSVGSASPRRTSGSESPSYPTLVTPCTPRRSSLSISTCAPPSIVDNQMHMMDHAPGSLVTPEASPLPPTIRPGLSQSATPQYASHRGAYSHLPNNVMMTPSHSPMIIPPEPLMMTLDPSVPILGVAQSTDDLEVMLNNNSHYLSSSHVEKQRVSLSGATSSPLKNAPVMFSEEAYDTHQLSLGRYSNAEGIDNGSNTHQLLGDMKANHEAGDHSDWTFV